RITLYIWSVLFHSYSHPPTPFSIRDGQSCGTVHSQLLGFGNQPLQTVQYCLGTHIAAAALDPPALREHPAIAHRPGKPHGPYGLVRRAALRSGNTADRYRQIGLGGQLRTFGHGPDLQLADSTDLLQVPLRDYLPTDLAEVGLGDEAGVEPAVTASDVGDG